MSSSVGTTFSMLASTMCTLGRVLREVAVALVGDDHRGAGLGDQEVRPGDADLGGEEFLAQDACAPRPGARPARRDCGPSADGCGRGGSPASICALRRCTAGMMMCDGISWRSWMMYSPRSVSIGAMPFCSRKSLRPISSPTIDLPLVTVRGADLPAEIEHDARAHPRRVARVVHVAALRRHPRLVGLEIEVEMRQRVVLDVAGGVAQRLELGQLVDHVAAPRREIRSRRIAAPPAAADRRARRAHCP